MIEIAIKRIYECLEQKKLTLSLDSLGLSELPPEIGLLTHLKTLYCSDNKLKSLAGVEKLKSLTKLNCSGNQLSSLVGVEHLTRLKILKCGGNLLTSLDGVEHLATLTALTCSSNRLTNLAGVEHLTSLKTLSCGNNQLTGLEGVEGLKTLTKLECQSSQLTSLASIEHLNSLEFLDCSRNQLTSLASLEHLTKLRTLKCSRNGLFSLQGLSQLKELKELNCSYNFLTSFQDVEFLSALTELNCNNNKLTSLDSIKNLIALTSVACSYNELTSLEGVEHLSALTRLECSRNKLTSLDGIEGLISLTTIFCYGNQLTSLACVKRLKALTILECGANKLVSLHGIEQLTSLRKLNCGGSQLISLDGIQGLKELTILNCSGNLLTSLDGIESLTGLTLLYCHANKLSSLDGIEHLNALTKIESRNNPIRFIPHAFLDDINSIRAYQEEIRQHGYLDNNRLKLMFLGNGRVGKTTLAHALRDKAPQNGKSQEESTIGISLLDWTATDSNGKAWQLRLWDFGGQELYHATHRLFQSQSGIYCVLWAEKLCEEKDDFNHPLRYWLDLVHESKTDVPVIVVKNQIDIANNLGLNNEALIDAPYCKLLQVMVSALSYQNVAVLESAILELLNSQSKLQIRIPQSWGKVRKKLEEMGGVIKKCDFEALCAKSNVLHADTLLAYLNQCGDVFYRENHFSNTIFIDQNWALKAIFRLFEISNAFGNPRGWILRNNGKVSGSELLEIFHDYERHEAVLFIEFMQQAQMMFNVGIRYEQLELKSFIVPALLPNKQPKGFPSQNNAAMQYQLVYPWLHRLAIERIIIECSHLSSEHHWWRNGIYISIGGGVQCSITANTEGKYLNLAFWGDTLGIKSVLPRVIKTIEATKVASPINEAIWIRGRGWCQVGDLRKYAALSEYVLDLDGNPINGMIYYEMLGIECRPVSEAEPTKPDFNCYIITETIDLSRTNINSPGAVLGDMKNSVLTINIGANNEERDERLAELKALIEQLQRESFCEKEQYLSYLKTIDSELQSNEPDDVYIGKTLSRFSKVMNHLEKGKEVYNRVVAFLLGFGITI